MPPFRKPNLVTLRRQNPIQAWGFRLAGGAEIGQSFLVQKVTPGSLSFLAGISEGDELVRIGNISLRGLTHDEVQQIIVRCTHCIDLFVVREDNSEVQPRFELVLKTPDQHNNAPEINRIQQYEFEKQQQFVVNEANLFEQQKIHNLPALPSELPFIASQSARTAQVFNKSAKPYSSTGYNQPEISPTPSNQQQYHQGQQLQNGSLSPLPVNSKPGSPASGRKIRIKSPINLACLQQQPARSDYSDSLEPPMTPGFKTGASQSFPTTPIKATKAFDFSSQTNDYNNNPTDEQAKVFGLASRAISKPILPLGNHGVQPVANERKFFGVNARQRFNSLSCERDWKASLPIVNIPNSDQLLPSQTKQMQTYINQTPPTEKYLKPSLVGLERRRIRPIWPPAHPGRAVNRSFAENRESPSSKMFNWPPRASSVEHDFGYGERSRSPAPDRMPRSMTPARGESPFNHNRVIHSTRQWPPTSNATPAGRSGYIPDEDEEENYAYNSRRSTRESTPVGSHIPRTYRSPPETTNLNQQIIVDF